MIRLFFYLDVMLTAAELTGPNVCFKGQTRAKVCCSDFEERNNRCIKCLSGFTAASGQYCVPCKEERFGDRCIKMCVCKVDERCDHVIGCVPIETVTDTSFDGGFNYSTNTEQNNEDYYAELLIYSASSAGVFVIITICYLYLQGRQTRRTQEVSNEENRNTSNGPESIEIREIHYYTINDDDVQSYREVEENSYLEVIVESSSSNSSSLKSRSNATTMQTNEMSYVHMYENSFLVHGDSESIPSTYTNFEDQIMNDSDGSERNIDDSEYMHPYYSLKRIRKVDTEYDIPEI